MQLNHAGYRQKLWPQVTKLWPQYKLSVADVTSVPPYKRATAAAYIIINKIILTTRRTAFRDQHYVTGKSVM